MQEKGRRLAQELPGFNWLEEKIRNGGMTTVLSPRRLSGAPYSRNNDGPVVDTSNTGTKEMSDPARSSGLPPSSTPPEYRLVTNLKGMMGG
jgi:hypothetical protein